MPSVDRENRLRVRDDLAAVHNSSGVSKLLEDFIEILLNHLENRL